MKTRPLSAVLSNAPVTPGQIAMGPPVPALDRLRIMSPQEWQDFTLEYAHSLKDDYHSVESHDGAGDQGCDIVARVDGSTTGPWDNYQCKRYAASLTPGDVFIELGKCCYYTLVGAYTVPRSYYFVAPMGAGAKLSKLLQDPVKLKDSLIGNWDDACRDKITSKGTIPLDAALRAHIAGLDFSIFKALSPLKIIEQHSKTRWHAARFGGGLPARPTLSAPPAELAAVESVYVRRLLDVYEEKLGIALAGIADLNDMTLTDHFRRARQEFYSAESLREFSRDNVPAGTFETLLDEVYSGVIDVIQATHPDAMERVLASVRQAKALALVASALVTRVTTADKGGMCHQLANERGVIWKK
jgi:hypothetical protein